MKKVVLGIGSNIGNGALNINKALKLIDNLCRVDKVSPIYLSRSLLEDEQADYYNICLLCLTDLTPMELFSGLQNIEIEMGRVKNTGRWGSRIIDIDIIDFNNECIINSVLEIPHKEMPVRSFVLYPLRDIIPDYIHPKSGKNIDDMVSCLKNSLSIRQIN